MKNGDKFLLLLILVGLFLSVSGCDGLDNGPSSTTQPPFQPLPTAEPLPTPQPIPTAGPLPTAEPIPTAEPLPTISDI